MHDRPWVHLDDGFRDRRAAAQSTVGSFAFVVFPTVLNKVLGLTQALEDLSIQERVAEADVDVFAVSVLPGGSWFDVRGLSAHDFDAILHGQRFLR